MMLSRKILDGNGGSMRRWRSMSSAPEAKTKKNAVTITAPGFFPDPVEDSADLEGVTFDLSPLLPQGGKKEEWLQEVGLHILDSEWHHSILEPAFQSFRFGATSAARELIERARAGLCAGHAPALSPEGSGGVYFLRDENNLENVAVFKPSDEEPLAPNNPRKPYPALAFTPASSGEGLKRGTRIKEGASREVAAYLLDHSRNGFSGVPLTLMVRCYHRAFNYSPRDNKWYWKPKLGSLQQFVHSVGTCEDMGPSKFPLEEVHKITVLDLRLANTDRHAGNILVCRDASSGSLRLVPIDHGYCLPEKFEDCTFEWLFWPQAKQPYEPSALEYIASLDVEEDLELLHQQGLSIRPQSAKVFRIATMVLKKGAAAGLSAFQIGSILCRAESLDKKSPIELMWDVAEALEGGGVGGCFLGNLSNLVDQYITTMKNPPPTTTITTSFV